LEGVVDRGGLVGEGGHVGMIMDGGGGGERASNSNDASNPDEQMSE
jgi:hypothetical protein